jgi:hypothetical protein
MLLAGWYHAGGCHQGNHTQDHDLEPVRRGSLVHVPEEGHEEPSIQALHA